MHFSNLFLFKNHFLFVEINLTTRGPLYTCLVYALLPHNTATQIVTSEPSYLFLWKKVAETTTTITTTNLKFLYFEADVEAHPMQIIIFLIIMMLQRHNYATSNKHTVNSCRTLIAIMVNVCAKFHVNKRSLSILTFSKGEGLLPFQRSHILPCTFQKIVILL